MWPFPLSGGWHVLAGVSQVAGPCIYLADSTSYLRDSQLAAEASRLQAPHRALATARPSCVVEGCLNTLMVMASSIALPDVHDVSLSGRQMVSLAVRNCQIERVKSSDLDLSFLEPTMLPRRRLVYASVAALVTAIFYLCRGSHAEERMSGLLDHPADKIRFETDLDKQYADAIKNRGKIIEQYSLENQYVLCLQCGMLRSPSPGQVHHIGIARLRCVGKASVWPHRVAHAAVLVKVFPPAFKCPHEISQVGSHTICAVGSIAKQPSCIVYSLAPSSDLSDLQGALTQTFSDQCDVFGYDLARNGFFYVALPNSHQISPEERMLVSNAPLRRDGLSGALSIGEHERDTEEEYAHPWRRLLTGEHQFIDIITVSDDQLTGSRAALPDNPRPLRAGQIILKLRLDEMRIDGMPMLPFKELRYMWEHLEYAGLRPFAAEVGADGYLEALENRVYYAGNQASCIEELI
ncbi:hypothetical protein DAEQUDRAFT_741767 [Daedalea quercina L-15889]|uniref:Uncharacterized protein n=1 Tax=Daedalea quercina L-15889 TaxID=1314783 RepID=A0A165KXA7_9APHY|nr:hypothetical protein DAEQUDRAFT_741767 [Daedalea quercina L-15889]